MSRLLDEMQRNGFRVFSNHSQWLKRYLINIWVLLSSCKLLLWANIVFITISRSIIKAVLLRLNRRCTLPYIHSTIILRQNMLVEDCFVVSKWNVVMKKDINDSNILAQTESRSKLSTDNNMLLMVLVHKTSLTPPRFIEVPVPSQLSER